MNVLIISDSWIVNSNGTVIVPISRDSGNIMEEGTEEWKNWRMENSVKCSLQNMCGHWTHCSMVTCSKPFQGDAKNFSEHLMRQQFGLSGWQKINKGRDMEEWGGCVEKGFLVKREGIVGYPKYDQNTFYTSVKWAKNNLQYIKEKNRGCTKH